MNLTETANCLLTMARCRTEPMCDNHCEHCDHHLGTYLEQEALKQAAKILGARGLKGFIMRLLWEN